MFAARVAHLLLASGFLLPSPAGSAESALCTVGAGGTLDALTLGLTDDLTPEDRETLRKPAADTAVLALLAIEWCPTASEQVLRKDKAEARRWLDLLGERLDSVMPPSLLMPTVAFMADAISCTPSSPNVCLVRRGLNELLRHAPRPTPVHNFCGSVGPWLTDSIVADLMAADGAYTMEKTQDVATILSFCPSQLYSFMHDHAKERRRWLDLAGRFLFFGDAPSRADLMAYRQDLIRSVEESLRDGQFEAENREFLSLLLTTEVRTPR